MTEQPVSDYTPGRKYVVPVAPIDPAAEPVDRHLAVLFWEPGVAEWVHGQSLCGRSVAQGPATDSGICCPDCITLLNAYPYSVTEEP